jgi:hypothetical protein
VVRPSGLPVRKAVTIRWPRRSQQLQRACAMRMRNGMDFTACRSTSDKLTLSAQVVDTQSWLRPRCGRNPRSETPVGTGREVWYAPATDLRHRPSPRCDPERRLSHSPKARGGKGSHQQPHGRTHGRTTFAIICTRNTKSTEEATDDLIGIVRTYLK